MLRLSPGAGHLLARCSCGWDCELRSSRSFMVTRSPHLIAAASIIAKVERDRMIVEWIRFSGLRTGFQQGVQYSAAPGRLAGTRTFSASSSVICAGCGMRRCRKTCWHSCWKKRKNSKTWSPADRLRSNAGLRPARWVGRTPALRAFTIQFPPCCA